MDWTDVNSRSPSTCTSSARRTASACAGPDVEIPTPHAALPQPGHRAVHAGVVEHAGLQRRGVHVVDAEPVAEQRPGLRDLLGERGERVVLDLVHVGVDPPVADVAVAPLRADLDVVDPGWSASQPARNSSARP